MLFSIILWFVNTGLFMVGVLGFLFAPKSDFVKKAIAVGLFNSVVSLITIMGFLEVSGITSLLSLATIVLGLMFGDKVLTKLNPEGKRLKYLLLFIIVIIIQIIAKGLF